MNCFNLINYQQGIDFIYLYAKNTYETKHQLQINKREGTDIKHFNDSEVFIVYSNDMDDIYRNIEEYNPSKKKRKYRSYLMM